MKRPEMKNILLAAVLALGASALPGQASAKAAKLVVVVKAGGSLTGLALKDVQEIYLGDKQFQNGDKIEPLVNGNEALDELFLKKILNKTKAQYKKIWSGKAFIDGVAAPSVLPSSADVLREVERDGDVIGFVAEKDMPAGDKNLKVICSVDSSN